MKRTPIKRRTEIKRTAAGPKNRKPIPKRNAARRAKLFDRNFGDHGEFVRGRGCVVKGCTREPVQAAHVVGRRGMGGCGSNKRALVGLCFQHHGEEEGRTAQFEAAYSINLAAEASRLWREHYPED